MATFYAARRELLFERFVAFWEGLQREGLRARLEYAVAERPPPPDAGAPLDADGAAGAEASTSDASPS